MKKVMKIVVGLLALGVYLGWSNAKNQQRRLRGEPAPETLLDALGEQLEELMSGLGLSRQ